MGHNLLLAKFSISYTTLKPERREIYKLRCEKGRLEFFKRTQFSKQFTNCFQNNKDFLTKSRNFFECIKSTVAQSFEKVRIVEKEKNNQKPDLRFSKLVAEKNDIKKFLRETMCKLGKSIASARSK